MLEKIIKIFSEAEQTYNIPSKNHHFETHQNIRALAQFALAFVAQYLFQFPKCLLLEQFLLMLVVKLIIVILIIFIGAPVFAWAGMLETILDLILPEGWNDDDDDEGKLP